MRRGFKFFVLLSLYWLMAAAALARPDPSPPGYDSGSRLRFVSPEKRWAVVVGVSRYEHLPKSAWLISGDKDAKAYAEFLLSPRGGGLPPSHLKMLLNEEATTKNVRLALDFLITNVTSGDVATIFFAGHGQVNQFGSGEVAYLMPYDSDPDTLNATALPMDEVRRYVDVHLREASQVVLITDACHSGAILSPEEDALKIHSINDHLQAVGQRDGVLNIMACRRDEVASEDPRLGGHGVLTYALLRALNGSARSTSNGIVRTQELLEYVTRQVPRLTDQEQHPRHGANYTDEFPLANLTLEGPAYQVPEEPRNLLDAQPTSVFSKRSSSATLKVYGASSDAEVYLVQGKEQRSVGRALSTGTVMVVEGLSPGGYEIVEAGESDQESWKVELTAGSQSFDLRTGDFR